MWFKRKSSVPPPPENVCVILLDGRTIPVDCRYDGWVNGEHRWTVVTPIPGPVRAITVDVFPPRTGISLEFEGEAH